MEADAILKVTAESYANLKSLAVDVLAIHESGDDGSVNRSEHRYRAFYAAPAKVRIEQSGRQGSVTVSDGVDVHHYLARPNRYSKQPAGESGLLLGCFRPDFPVPAGPAFLFSRIAESVAFAELLREEVITIDGSEASCHVVRVRYETAGHPNLMAAFSPMTLWLDRKTHLVLRAEGEVSHRIPAHDEAHTSRQSVVLTGFRINEPIPAETFEYTPPADVNDDSTSGGMGFIGGGRVGVGRRLRGRGFMGGRGGSGATYYGGDPAKSLETWHSHEWAGESVVEHSKLRFRGIELSIERRLTLSADAKELRIVESMTGPNGKSEREFTIPVG